MKIKRYIGFYAVEFKRYIFLIPKLNHLLIWKSPCWLIDKKTYNSKCI